MADVEPGPSNDYQVSPTLTFSRQRWNTVMASIAARLKARELLEATFETLIANGTQAALDLISQNVAPQLEDLIEQINALEEQLEDIIGGGTAPNALQLGGQNPSYYLALANATGTLPVEKVTGVSALIDAAVASLVNGSPAALDTLKELSDALGGDANFAASVAAALGGKLAKASNLSDLVDKDAALVNLLGGATGIQIFKRATTAAIRTDLQIDRWNRARSRVINGGMRINQRGTGAVDLTGGSDTYPVDRWRVSAFNAGGTLRAQQVLGLTPGGSSARVRLTVINPKPALAAAELYYIYQGVEGANVVDASFGASYAKPLILRIGVMSSVAGTFAVAYRNAAATLSFLGSFTIAAGDLNTEVVKFVRVSPKTDGTWPVSDGVLGATISVCLAAGATYSAAGGWQSGNFVGLTGQTNFMATAGATFDLFDVGFYVDHDDVGIVPPFEPVDWEVDLNACRRFYRPLSAVFGGPKNGGATNVLRVPFSPRMRAQPTLGIVSSAGPGVDNAVSRDTAHDYIQIGFTAAATGSFILAEEYSLNAEF